MLFLAILGLLSPDVTGDPIAVTLAASAKSEGDHIRHLAFDGDPATYFATEGNARQADHFLMTFDRPVVLKSVDILTGNADGKDALDAGVLEGSADGEAFDKWADFAEGKAHADSADRAVRALRIRPTGDMDHPLAIREITLDADPKVATFRYPVEFTLNTDDAPDLKDWAEAAALACERAYPMINDELKSDGFQPPKRITMTLKSSYKGVAEAGGTRITGSVDYFRKHPDDLGAMVHETTHLVQRYRGRGNPGWLVEGVADYIRFVKYEPAKIGPINAERSHYNGSYRVTAAFLGYLAKTYDGEIVRKLNAAMRSGTYKDAIFEELTGKTLKELDDDWRATLAR